MEMRDVSEMRKITSKLLGFVLIVQHNLGVIILKQIRLEQK